MNYEQKYNEALEAAQQIYKDMQSGGNYGGMEDLEVIFPELAESEDERIRRTLVEYFGPQVQLDFVRGVPIQKIRDWLEKQKKLKPVQTEDEKEYVRTLKSLIADFLRGKEEVDKLYYQKIYDWLDGRHIEQKSEDRFEEAREKYQVEWSEEDEKLFWGFTAWVPNDELERLGVTRNDILKKLKSIRPQPIQLKEAYKDGFQTARHATALTFMNYLDENRPEGKMGLSNAECKDIDKAFKENDWEKIIKYVEKYRPSWKPSDEQIYSLGTVVKGYDECTVGSVGYHLKEMYEQLKKLM